MLFGVLLLVGLPIQVFADAMVSVPEGTSVPGCETTNECFIPYEVNINVGESVIWSNDDSAAHTVTSGSAADGASGVFDSSLFMAGTTFSHEFENSGTFPYHCMVHPWMEGTVIVEDTGNLPPPPEPSIDVTPPKILQPNDIEIDLETFDKVTRVTFEVLVIDDTDKIIRPTCKPNSGYLFGIGETIVKCTARDSAWNFAIPVSFTVKINPPEPSIPAWVKSVAEFWCEDKIDDGAFVDGIQYLIDNGIIVVSGTSTSYSGSQEVPQWVKNNACWWAKEMITDKDFASGIEYLVSQGIIRV